MKASGLLISCATPAAIWPMAASFSLWASWVAIRRSRSASASRMRFRTRATSARRWMGLWRYSSAPGLQALQLAVRVVELGGEEHHRHARAGRVLADAPADLEPVHVGHADVEQDQVDPAFLHLLQGLAAAERAEHAKPFRLQVGLDEADVRRLVVHHQDLRRLLVPVWALVVTPLQH